MVYNASAMDWLLAVSYWLLAIETIGSIRVIGSLLSNIVPLIRLSRRNFQIST